MPATSKIKNSMSNFAICCGSDWHFNPLPAANKMHLEMLSAKVICCMYMNTSMTNFAIQTNSKDLNQTAPRA